MKKQILLGSMVIASAMAHAQTWGGSTTTSGDIWHDGRVGINNHSPSFRLDIKTGWSDDGINVEQNAYSGGAWLVLNNTYSGQGRRWGIESGGDGSAIGAGNFAVHDATGGAARLFIEGTTGNVGIGSLAPTAKLMVMGTSAGVSGQAAAASCTGTRGDALGTGGASGQATGVYGFGGGSYTNYGGYFETNASFPSGCVAGRTSYGIFARVLNPGCGGVYAGYFQGEVNVAGNVYANGYFISSDKQLKKEIKPLTNGLDKIRLLNPSTYLFKTDEFKAMNLPKEKQIGLIAQELEQVFPELVTEVDEVNILDKEGNNDGTIPKHKIVNYVGLIPVLISAVQDQDKTIQVQQKQLSEQKALIDQLLQKTGTTTGINSNNPGAGDFSMLQNEPNPFSHETVIKYTLPQQVNTASLIVYDLTGKQLASFPVTEKGASSITITSEKLAAGIYIYSIVADGKVVDSKRMIVAEK